MVREDPEGEEFHLSEIIREDLQKLYKDVRVLVDVRLECNSLSKDRIFQCQLAYGHDGGHWSISKNIEWF